MKSAGSKVLITGGSTGIGRAIAEALSEKGASVGITGRREALVEAAAQDMGALALTGDVSAEEQCVETVQRFVEHFGGIDVLVNNAGFGHFAPLVDMDRTAFEAVFATNVTGAMLMAREATKHFVEQSSGTSSTSRPRRV